MFAKPQVDVGSGAIQLQSPGVVSLTQEVPQAIVNAAGVTLTAEQISTGFIDRSGAAGVSDTLPSADQLLAANPQLMFGDAFRFVIANANSGLLTLAAGEGITLAGTTTVAAGNQREYLATVQSAARRQVVAGNTTNGSAVLTGIPPAILNMLAVGMGVTGTNIPANSTVIGVNATAGTVTISANATGTGSQIAFTFFPRITVRGVFTAAV